MSAAIEFDGGTSTLFDIPVGGFWFRIKIWNLEHENSPVDGPPGTRGMLSGPDRSAQVAALGAARDEHGSAGGSIPPTVDAWKPW